MPSNERDPRKDPRPGDALLCGPQWQTDRYTVIGRNEREVDYCIGGSRPLCCTIGEWQEWMVGAEVLHVAE